MIRIHQATASPLVANPSPLATETQPTLMTSSACPGERAETLWTRLGSSGQQRLAQHWAVLIRRMRLQVQPPPDEVAEGGHEPQ